MITAIFSAKDAEMSLAHALHALVPAAMDGIVREVIVVDGGSRDGTRMIADAAGCEIVENSGSLEDDFRRVALGARADWLLFLSPAAVLETEWHKEALDFIDRALETGKARSCAATFRLGRSGDSFGDRVAEWLASFRTRTLAAPHPEQGLLISRALYRELGGHRQLAAMTEVDLARRIGRRRLTLLRKRANVRMPAGQSRSVMRAVRNGMCLTLFVLRLPPALIGRLAAG
jgi:glycosyltransferase involved in cell wall biosynthesis